jgi:hypothetical protein
MTTGAVTSPTMTYARARLFLGASAVGTTTVLAALALLLDLPHRALPVVPAGWGSDIALLALVVALHGAITAPFDLFGGLLLPREYGRSREGPVHFAARWARGALVWGAGVLAAALLLMVLSRVFGAPGALLAYTVATLAFLVAQPLAASLVAGGRVRRAHVEEPGLGTRALVMTGLPRHATGGAYGLPGRSGWVLPDHFLGRHADVHLARRRYLERSGLRDRGVAVAMVWNALPLLAVLLLAGAPVAVADVVRLGLVATLWSFVGLFVLPAPSRRAVYAADLAALATGTDHAALASALHAHDRAGDDEPDRPDAVESVFHPIPALGRRLDVLAGRRTPPQGLAAWHAARLALPLSGATFGLLGRSVHCALGRPEAWVFLPSE